MSAAPYYSVIVPAHGAAHLLPKTLGALVASDFPRDRWELIVVDDASPDDTAAVAGEYADTVVRLPGRPHGPAYARNRGFEVSRGDVIVFFDADVRVHTDTLRRFAEYLEQQPGVGAVFGSYDNAPPAPGLMSQYRNLLHHYVHQKNPGDVETFWAGAGAIRRSIFDEAGLYDEWHYARPQIEDIELGSRIRSLGHRIVLRPEIQVTHLKHWTFFGVVRTDIRDRGIPWSRLLAQRGTMLSSATLNLKTTEKLNTVLVWLALMALFASLVLLDVRWLALSLALLVPVVALNHALIGFFARTRGVLFAMAIVPVHLLYYLLNGISFAVGLLLHQTIGAPLQDPTVEAYAEMGLQRWPPIPIKSRRSTWSQGGDE